MKLSDIIQKYNFKVFTPSLLVDKQITYGFCSDLMSDALILTGYEESLSVRFEESLKNVKEIMLKNYLSLRKKEHLK